ncbi:hypothetical protein OCK02_08660 [Rhizobium sp. TRM96647]|uniref:hypothetical protein n=1 Tax=unclassified Rhizobium TaxID=2613769 RepID=UPI0021E77BB0|nr:MULTISPECIES: hypothetical protein [unclassified Rhizobium]MCV3736275.1 hypothetical protein [Rhizobium sp. TRM96647]MCV3758644.1 hypothetical protein [Rhizobium sp. TRM96650]
MTKTKHAITPEKLAAYTIEALDTLRGNALRLDAHDVVQMCDDELARRPPRRQRLQRYQAEHTEHDVVTGYHFVCSANRGVLEAQHGQFWSGAWVVAEQNVRESLRYGAYLALHESKADVSYRQGQIIDYRMAPRDMVAKSEEGIEFLVRTTNEPYGWTGGGAGEKGYRWEKVVRNPEQNGAE